MSGLSTGLVGRAAAFMTQRLNTLKTHKYLTWKCVLLALFEPCSGDPGIGADLQAEALHLPDRWHCACLGYV